ncbi:flagellar hook-basal body protein [Salimicrobium halophilum]|uniref:Flagellar basal-body rod protein FlgG n=1 Tax=Salimicrobium halophilum TaxID=86666 RepID=A0A1G8SG12_9BACI|nr:flagellar hook-basal body protein [Salimicrobium halophilum]SDJ28094.1 flagellar basal-body rod protein FlgG [Salimicrobium halophilum]
MFRGFYTSASAMVANQRNQETLSNNIANANTPGYKQDQGVKRAFPEMLIHEMGSKSIPTKRGLNIPIDRQIGSMSTGMYLQETVPSFTQGDVRETGNTTDMALVQGEVPDEEGFTFFNVQNEEGEARFTRNGNFTVDGEGFLTTNNGYYVLNEDGDPIQTGGMEFNILQDGTMQIGDDEELLGVTYTSNSSEFIKQGDDLFEAGEDAVVADARAADGVNFEVQQGMLERSNVDAQQTMTEMMSNYRSFELNQRVMRAYDQNMQTAVSEIGRLQ